MFGNTGPGTQSTTSLLMTPATTTAPAASTGFSVGSSFNFGTTPFVATTTVSSSNAQPKAGCAFSFSKPDAAPSQMGGFTFNNTAVPATTTSAVSSSGFTLTSTPKPAVMTTAPSSTAAGTTGLLPMSAQTAVGFQFGLPSNTVPSTSTATPAPGLLATTTTDASLAGVGTSVTTGGTGSLLSTTTLAARPLGTATGTTSAATTTLGNLSSKTTFTGGLATTTSGSHSVSGSSTTTASSAATGFGLTTHTTSSQAVVGAESQMTYHQMEELINKWMVEVGEHEKAFLQQATQINAWDRLLVENGDKISHLNHDMEQVKIDQKRLENELDFICSQQKELEELLVPLEKAMEQLPPLNYQHHADIEREHMYQLAESIDAQLKRMMQDLKEIIDHLNTTNSNQENNDPYAERVHKSSSPLDPISLDNSHFGARRCNRSGCQRLNYEIFQIIKILNAHMDSLRWIDQNAGLLNRRVEDISKQMDLKRKEQERNYRLVYN